MTQAEAADHGKPFPSEREEFLLRGPAGALECSADVPEEREEVPATIIVCHPHPQHGGTMHNKVVTIIERSMRELGLRTVLFNFRGVGESEGSFDDGYGETDDLFSVIEWIRRARPDDDLWLGGFSFGAYVALRAAQNVQLGQLISVAPPVDKYAFAELEHPGWWCRATRTRWSASMRSSCGWIRSHHRPISWSCSAPATSFIAA
jgi:hypothetical protein